MRQTADRVVCDALGVKVQGDIRIEAFDRSLQDDFRLLVLAGMAERWGTVDESLNTDLEDIETWYADHCILVALDGALVVGTGILLVRDEEGEIARMAVRRDYRQRGIARQLLAELVSLAARHEITRIVAETNAEWREARRLYETSGFTFTHTAQGKFGTESFYELHI